MNYDSHTNNVMAVGFQRDGNWMYSGSEDGTVKFGTWVMGSFYNMAPGFQREYESRAAVKPVVLRPNQIELISGDQNGNIRIWDLRANSCSCELVPEVDTAVGSLTVMWDGSLIVAANKRGTCYVWRLLQGTQTMSIFEPLHKLLAHDGYILKCLLSPEFCEPNRLGSMTFLLSQELLYITFGLLFRIFLLYSNLRTRLFRIYTSDHTVKIWNVDGFAALKKTDSFF
ncbi:target of rapamycin complex subunit LST8-like isoform X2 [Primulina tabacum]